MKGEIFITIGLYEKNSSKGNYIGFLREEERGVISDLEANEHSLVRRIASAASK